MTPFQLAHSLLEDTYDYATTDIRLEDHLADFIIDWGRLNIPDDALADKGREDYIHITVKYGLRTQDIPSELQEIARKTKPFPIFMGVVSLFTTSPEYDVVKIDVESPWLRQLNRQVSYALPHEDTHPDYHPHITVAYVKKGTCDHLEGDDPFKDKDVPREFTAYGMGYKPPGDEDDPERTEQMLLFSKTAKPDPALVMSESELDYILGRGKNLIRKVMPIDEISIEELIYDHARQVAKLVQMFHFHQGEQKAESVKVTDPHDIAVYAVFASPQARMKLSEIYNKEGLDRDQLGQLVHWTAHIVDQTYVPQPEFKPEPMPAHLKDRLAAAVDKARKKRKVREAVVGLTPDRPLAMAEAGDWHSRVKLEVAVNGRGRHIFLRNGRPVGTIESFDPQRCYLAGIGVSRSLRRTGLGHAMIGFLFDRYPEIKEIELDNWSGSRQFFYSIGGRSIQRFSGGDRASIKRENFVPAPFRFTEVPWNRSYDDIGFGKFLEAVVGPKPDQMAYIEKIIADAMNQSKGDPQVFTALANDELNPMGVYFEKHPMQDQHGTRAMATDEGVFLPLPSAADLRSPLWLKVILTGIHHELVHGHQISRMAHPEEVVARTTAWMMPNTLWVDQDRYLQQKQEIMAWAASMVESWRKQGLNKEQMIQRLRSGNWGYGMKYWHSRRSFPQAFNRFIKQALEYIDQLSESSSEIVATLDPFAGIGFPVDPAQINLFLRTGGKRREERPIL